MKNLTYLLVVLMLSLGACTVPVGTVEPGPDTGIAIDVEAAPVCGNGIVEAGEGCDGNPYAVRNYCEDFGFLDGQVTCTNSCTIDTSGCRGEPTCGDGVTEEDEECDGDTFVTRNYCEDYGFDRGQVLCVGCRIDTSGCYNDPEPAVCGNGVREAGEVCDGTDLGGDSCQTAGWTGGELRCTANCLVFDASDCFH